MSKNAKKYSYARSYQHYPQNSNPQINNKICGFELSHKQIQFSTIIKYWSGNDFFRLYQGSGTA